MTFVAQVPKNSPAEYVAFWRQWQRGEYFACHETLEELWRREASDAKPFYQGLIHGAVALHHAESKNVIGATRQLEKARRRLAPFGEEYLGVNIAEFLRDVETKIESKLAGGHTSGMLENNKE